MIRQEATHLDHCFPLKVKLAGFIETEGEKKKKISLQQISPVSRNLIAQK